MEGSEEESLRRKWKVVRRRVDGVSGRWWGSEMLLFGRGFFFFFLSLGTTRPCFRRTSLLTSKPMFFPRDTISSITAESSLSKPKSVRNSRHSTSSEAFVNRGLTVCTLCWQNAVSLTAKQVTNKLTGAFWRFNVWQWRGLRAIHFYLHLMTFTAKVRRLYFRHWPVSNSQSDKRSPLIRKWHNL